MARYSARFADELAESWVNGNRAYVYDAITRVARTKRDAVALAVRVAEYLAGPDPYDLQTFIRYVTDMAP